MPVFQYKAATADGETVNGTLRGTRRDLVTQRILALGLLPIGVF